MSQQSISQDVRSESLYSLPSLRSLPAIGAMLATFAVITYACLQSDDSAVRARAIMQGIEVILFTWMAGFVASVLHQIALAAGAALRRIGQPSGHALAGA